jgi:hypothetical protein
MRQRVSRFCCGVLVLGLATLALVGCGDGQATAVPQDEGASDTYESEVLDTSYEDSLGVSNQLSLGTLLLEETDDAVTPDQAKALLPLWQALQGGVTAQAEVEAVLKQIEGTMTNDQLAAIARMQLTREDMGTWMQEQGVGFGGGPPGGTGGQGQSPEARATRQAESGFGEGREMPPEMATRRAQFESMSEEEREEMRATIQAGGGLGGRGGGPGGAGRGQFPILLSPLVELLEARAGEM